MNKAESALTRSRFRLSDIQQVETTWMVFPSFVIKQPLFSISKIPVCFSVLATTVVFICNTTESITSQYPLTRTIRIMAIATPKRILHLPICLSFLHPSLIHDLEFEQLIDVCVNLDNRGILHRGLIEILIRLLLHLSDLLIRHMADIFLI